MKIKNICFFVFTVILILSTGCANHSDAGSNAVTKIIFDTDLGPDYDDVGALAFLNAMADSGKVEILATLSCNKNSLVAPSIEIINTYFGREHLPVGAPKTAGVSLGSSQHWADSLVAKYSHSISSTDDVGDAVTSYRKILSLQPDNSVTIVTTGFLTNLANLLKSDPDKYSTLRGRELVIKKVKCLVSMAGKFPEGREFNLYMDSLSSEYVSENWPGKIIFTGFETGVRILTGLRLIKMDLNNSPVKDVYEISMHQSAEDSNGRKSWDQTAVLIATYGTEGFFDTVKGRIVVNRDGSNSWKDDPDGNHEYVILKMRLNEISRFIEDRMMHLPSGQKGRQFRQ
jgi:inosine-uridine nucleoside N-ribohydrolase